ncbi:MAG: hypothetical protein KDA68_05445 [Planctomycetaceae bacterium]|nr:hypothetical protein [Planctomycetaceae bacterium]
MRSPDFRVLAYVARLEMALERIRLQASFVNDAAMDLADRIKTTVIPGATTEQLEELRNCGLEMERLLIDLQEPTQDQEADVAITFNVKSMVESIFRWQLRLTGLKNVCLHLDVAEPDLIWFPSRMRHILDCLFSNSLKYQDELKGEGRVLVSIHQGPDKYELRISDNGIGLTRDAELRMFQLFDRSDSGKLVDPVVGLAVLKLLIEQAGGDISVQSSAGQGMSFVVSLPRYQEGDYID